MRKTITTLLCAAVLLGAQGRRAPGFCLSDSTGQWRDLADYRGKLVILEFMQTTCPHCAVFANILKEAQQKYGERIAVIAMVTAPDTPTTMIQYVNGHKVTYPVLFDQGQAMASYVRKGSLNFPTIYLIDANGMIKGEYEYSELTKPVFEGRGLFTELDRLVGGSSPLPKKK
jgi:peroxiredoxin